MLPQVNATLLSVARGGYSEDYDRTADSSPPNVWQGTADAYVQRKVVSAFNDAGELRRALRVTILIDGPPIHLEPGDTITYQTTDPTSQTTFVGRLQTGTNPAYLPVLPNYDKWALEEIEAP